MFTRKAVWPAVALIIIICTFLAATDTQKVHAASTELSLSQSCSATTGRVTVTFAWRNNEPDALQQWLDLSIFVNGWQDGTFLGAGPFPASSTGFSWDGILSGITHYVRVNQQLPNGFWDPSVTYYFTTPT